MNISKELKNLFVGFVMGLSDVDKKMIFGNKNPDETQINVLQKSIDKNADFLSAIKKGELSEQQLKWFYKYLDKMDDFHRNGGASAAVPGMLTEQNKFKKQMSNEPGFNEEYTFTNKYVDDSIGSTLTILREGINPHYKIENYCHDIVIKSNETGTLLAEFYCTNYKNTSKTEAELSEDLYEKLSNQSLLRDFTNIKAFNAVRSTATRNAIDHAYVILKYYTINSLDKGFVVKFVVEELK